MEGVNENKLSQILTKTVTETQQEYIENQKKEMGSLYSENMIGEFKNEYFSNIEKVIKNGGKISLASYNSLDGGQKYAFDKRYGKSKISGEILYHSTNKEFGSFDLSKVGSTTDNGWWGKGIYFFKDKKSANDFSLRNKGSVVKKATVNLKNPLVLGDENLPKNVIEAFKKRGIKVETIWDIQSYALDDMNKNPERITETLMSLDYDGVYLDLFPNKEVLVFNTSSIDKPLNINISEAYHKAKADGSNPELVKAVEDLLGGKKGQPKAEEAIPALKDVESTAKALEGVDTKYLKTGRKPIGDGKFVRYNPDDVLPLLKDFNPTSIEAVEDYVNKTVPSDASVEAYKLVPIDAILPSEKIEKKDRDKIEKIKKGIEKGDDIPPIVLDFSPVIKNGEEYRFGIMDGHHRFIAYKELGVNGIPSAIITSREHYTFETNDVNISSLFNKNQEISEAYHKAKADGTNPELVEAVEDLLGKPTEQPKETIPNVETKKADIERRRKEALDKANKQIEKTNKKEDRRVKVETYRTLDIGGNPVEVEITLNNLLPSAFVVISTSNADGSRLLRARQVNEDGSIEPMAYITERINNKFFRLAWLNVLFLLYHF